MRKKGIWQIVGGCLAVFLVSAACIGSSSDPIRTADGGNRDSASDSPSDSSALYFVGEYDPARDPFADVQAAVVEAQQTNKNILLDVGGDWCVWCHILDDYIAEHDDVAAALAENYVVVKINFSQENENAEFMAQFPDISGYPHFFVLDSDGNFLHSQDTGLLEQGQSYNHRKMLAFLEEWSP